jgi:hypothetical protein
MSSCEIEKIVCYRCHALLDLGDNFCRRCGVPTTQAPSPSQPAVSPQPLRFGESRVVILVMLFVVLGPLALPMLWRSRCFSLAWKIILTVLVVGATLAVFWLLWYTVHAILTPLQRAFTGGL